MWLKVLLHDETGDVFVNENSIKKIIQVDQKEGYDDDDEWYEYNYYDIHYVDGDVDNRVKIHECGKIKEYEDHEKYGITMK